MQMLLLCRNSYNFESFHVQNHHLLFESWHPLLLLRKLLLLLAFGKYYLSVMLVHCPTPTLSYTMCLIVGHRFIFPHSAQPKGVPCVLSQLRCIACCLQVDMILAWLDGIGLRPLSSRNDRQQNDHATEYRDVRQHFSYCVLGL